MATVLLGNTAPIETYYPNEDRAKVGDFATRELNIGDTVTTYAIPPDVQFAEAILTVTRTYNLHHSKDAPEWVESENPLLAEALKQHYTTEDHEVVVGRPSDWEERTAYHVASPQVAKEGEDI